MNTFPHDNYSHPEYYDRPNRRFHFFGVMVPAALITVVAGAVIFAATVNAGGHPEVVIPCSQQLCPRPTSSATKATATAKKAGQALKQSAVKISTQDSDGSDTATSDADFAASETAVPAGTQAASPASLVTASPAPNPSVVPSPARSAATSPSSSAAPSPNPSPNLSLAPSPGPSASSGASPATRSLSIPATSA
jgi:hypothetical protein